MDFLELNFHPLWTYCMGVFLIAIGVYLLVRPEAGYAPEKRENLQREGFAPLLVYFQKFREISYGLVFVTLQYWKQDFTITWLATILSLAGLVDLLTQKGEARGQPRKVFGHWMSPFVVNVWAVCRGLSALISVACQLFIIISALEPCLSHDSSQRGLEL